MKYIVTQGWQLTVEMWRLLGFCSARSGCDKIITKSGFGYILHQVQLVPFCMIYSRGSQSCARDCAMDFYEECTWQSATG